MAYDFNPLIDLYGQTVANELSPEELQKQAQALQAQGIDKGLSVTPQGQITFAGPVAGYNGPVRPSDVPYDVYKGEQSAIPVYAGSKLSPDTVQAKGLAEEERLRNVQLPGGGTVGKLMDTLAPLAKMHLSPEAQQGVINSVSPGLIKDKPQKATLAERAAAELTARTKNGGNGVDPLLGGFSPEELKVIAGVESKPKTNSDVLKSPPPNLDKSLTATYFDVYNSTKGNSKQKHEAAMAAANAAAQKFGGYTATYNEGMFGLGSGVKATAPTSGGKKTLDAATAQQFLQRAGGDKARARQLAKQAGYEF